jgi:surfeit locus 1 family protein
LISQCLAPSFLDSFPGQLPSRNMLNNDCNDPKNPVNSYMRFNFSWKITVTCAVLALGMIRASIWQWDRHIQKQELITTLRSTLEREVVELRSLLNSPPNWSAQTWRRVKLSGSFDFDREVIVRRNRGENDHAGFHVITPLKLDSSEIYVLVDRGFIPLGRHEREYRKRYHRPQHVELYGLVKEASVPKLFAPNDPPASLDKPWVDLWIRVNVEAISKQLPYPVLPIYLEVMSNPEDPLLADRIVKEGSAGRNDVLALTGQKNVENFGMSSPDLEYPLPHFDTTPPPDIHLGYVYEWGFMALLTLGIGFIAQLRRR